MSRSELSEKRRIHVVGVGGAGMSVIASVLAAMGHQVSGSDLKASAATQRLAAAGVSVFVGHDAADLAGAEIVTMSSAIPEANSEMAEARRRVFVCCHGPRCWPRPVPCADVWRWGNSRQDHHDVEIGLDPGGGRPATELSHRGERERDRHERRLGMQDSGWW